MNGSLIFMQERKAVSIHRKLLPLKWVGRVCSFKKDNLEACLSLNLELGPYSIRNLYFH